MKEHIKNAARKHLLSVLKLREAPIEDFGDYQNAFTLLFATCDSITKAFSGEVKNIDLAFGDIALLENLREEITALKDQLQANHDTLLQKDETLRTLHAADKEQTIKIGELTEMLRKANARVKTLESVSDTASTLHTIESKIDQLLKEKQNGETKSEIESTENKSTSTTTANESTGEQSVS